MPILAAGTTSTDLVTIDDVAAHLNWSDNEKTKQQTEMARFISAVTAVVESITGPVSARDYDEWYDGGAPLIMLNYSPVISVTKVTETFGANVIRDLTEQPLDGVTPVDAYGYTVDLQTGTLIRRVSGMTGPFAGGRRNVHVTYTAGYGAVPANVSLGALELIRINWQPQQGGNRPGYTSTSGVDEMQVDGSWRMGYFVPNRVMELLAPTRNTFGIA